MNQQASTIGTKGFSPFDYVKITILGFALTALWSSLHSIILPIRLLNFAAESQKNTYLGLLTFIGLILAMLVQPIVGTISDRSGSGWGRRRPYVLLGAVLAVLFLPGIGLAGSYIILLIAYCLIQVSGNTVQSAYQAFIPDLTPETRRGLASGVKGLLEILGGVALVRLIAYPMGRYFKGEGDFWLWLALGILAAILAGAMIVTVITVKERPVVSVTGVLLLSTVYKSFKVDVKANPHFLMFLVSRGLMGMPGVMLQTFALYYLMDVIGIANPAAATADLMIVVGLCMLAVAYPAGYLSDRIGRKPIVISSGLIGGLGVVLLLFSQSYTHIMLSGAIIGIANGALLSSSWALATDLVRKGEEARYLGLTNLAVAGSSALARLIGPVIDFFNSISAGLGYKVMLLVCLVCFIVGALLIIKVKQRRPLG